MGEQVRVAGNSGPIGVGALIVGPGGVPLREVIQHGSIGDFLGSSLEGVESGFIRCVYTAKNHSANTVTLLCEKLEGCCLTGCCPKDQFWMTGLIILLIFVLLLLCCGTIIILICYQRSKIQQRREEKEIYEATRGPPGGSEQLMPTGSVGGIYSRPVYSGHSLPRHHPQQHHYTTTATLPRGPAHAHYSSTNITGGGNMAPMASRRF